jgi:hypothetical protein
MVVCFLDFCVEIKTLVGRVSIPKESLKTSVARLYIDRPLELSTIAVSSLEGALALSFAHRVARPKLLNPAKGESQSFESTPENYCALRVGRYRGGKRSTEPTHL